MEGILPVDDRWWQCHIALRSKRKLLSPFVHDFLDRLPLEWKSFAHAVHCDIYENWDTTSQLIMTSQEWYRNSTIYWQWCFMLSYLGKSLNDVHPLLKQLIESHL